MLVDEYWWKWWMDDERQQKQRKKIMGGVTERRQKKRVRTVEQGNMSEYNTDFGKSSQDKNREVKRKPGERENQFHHPPFKT